MPSYDRYSRPIHSLVLDTAPLLTVPYSQIKSYNAAHYYTVPLAKEEVKDETARAALEIWANELRVRQPHPKSIQEVTSFAKKTGDYAVLSIADIHVLALTYELECDLNRGDWRLHKEPGSKERRGVPPVAHSRSELSTSPGLVGRNGVDVDDDTRSVVTDFTVDSVTPSESASVISNNPFIWLQRPTSSGSSTPTSSKPPTTLLLRNDNDEFQSELSNSTTKATIDTTSAPPSVVSTVSVVSARSGVSKDWSIESDDNELEDPSTPTQTIEMSIETLVVSDSESDDGEGTWITPSSLRKQKVRSSTTTNSLLSSTAPSSNVSRRTSDTSDYRGTGPSQSVLKSACMTADFAMQNVALQMGLNLVNMEGRTVKEVRTWVLRCHGCFEITKKMDLKFCPRCGGNTLLRTSSTTTANGEVKIHLKKNMEWTNRGTVFALQKPHGMSATPSLSTPPPILRADQKEYVSSQAAKTKREKDLMDPDNIPAFLSGKGKVDAFGYGGRNSGRIGGGRGRGTNAVRRR